jgi:uncharacterized membrane protein
MSAAVFALALAGALFLDLVVLPIVLILRTSWLKSDVSRLRVRLEDVERQLQRALAATGTPAKREAAPPAGISAPEPPAGSAEEAGPAAGTAEMPAHEPVPAAASAEGTAPVPLPERPAVAVAAARTATHESLESRIGGRWLLYVGTAALVLGVGFFVKYAFDNNWITETARVVIGAVIGLVMVLGGHRIARRGYPLYGQILAGGGFAALYITVFAALSYYSLISRPVAFGLMVLVTAGAALAADVHRSQGLAVFAVAGGFLTPFLVGGDRNAQVVLLTYDAILAVGTASMAARRGWPFLNLLSFAAVLLTFIGWADEYYTPDQWAPTEVFLAFFGSLYTLIGIRMRRLRNESADIVGSLLLVTPVVFHVASVANLQPHWMPLLVYLTLFALAGVVASMKLDAAWLRLGAFIVAAPVLWGWIGTHHGSGWLLAPAVVVLAIYVMMLVALGERVSRQPARWLRGDLALFHANGLGLFAGLYMIFEPVAAARMPWLALGLGAWHGAVAWAVRATSGEAGLNSLALAFAMLGFAIGLKFDEWWAVVGWAVESAAVIWVGLKARREWMRLGGALLLAWTLVRLLTLGYFETPAAFSPLFNPRAGATLVIVAVCYALAVAHEHLGGELRRRAQPEITVLFVLGNALALALLTAEINSYWRVRESIDAAARLARGAWLSVAWAVYGTALIVVGIVRRYAPSRYLAIGLLASTAAKVFLVDLSTLGGIYRIAGFVGLGVLLLLGAWLYQRYKDVIR